MNAFKDVVRLILPKEIFDFFEVVDLKEFDKEVHIYLDEINTPPKPFDQEECTSKGFHAKSIVQDFPLRDKATYLHIRKRKWLVESSGKIISRDWNTVAKGTRLTKDFAAFLKGILGQLPNKQ